MADITMCNDENCPKKETCYRYNAKINEYCQSYFGNSPRKGNGTCDFYWKIKKEKLPVINEDINA